MTNRWREALSTLADLCQVLPWVVMGIAAVGYAVGRLSRAQLAVVVVAALALFGVLAWWRRHEWWRKVRPRYASAVVWLARPVRDELAAMVLDDGDPEKADFEADLRERVRGLSSQALVTLRGFLRAYRPTGSRTFGIAPRSDTESEGGLSREQKVARYALACEELQLKENGFISAWHMAEDDEKVVVTLAPCVRPGLVLRLLDWLTEELNTRGVKAAP